MMLDLVLMVIKPLIASPCPPFWVANLASQACNDQVSAVYGVGILWSLNASRLFAFVWHDRCIIIMTRGETFGQVARL